VIKGADSFEVIPTFTQTELARSQIILRRSKYRRTFLLSQYFGNTIDDPVTAMEGMDGQGGSSGNINPQIPTENQLLYRSVNDEYAILAEANAITAQSANPRISSSVTIPWFEFDANPGLIVPFLSSADPNLPETPVGRGLDFRQVIQANLLTLAPSIAGVIYNFTTGGQTTQIVLEDWRAIAQIGEP